MLTSQNVRMTHVTSSDVFKGICRDLRSIFETILVKMIELCWQGGLGSSAADCWLRPGPRFLLVQLKD